MDTIEVSAPIAAPPPPARLPAFHRGMRTALLLNALGPLFIFPFGYVGLGIWFLMFCASVVTLIWTLYAVLRWDRSKLAPGIALALVLYFCANALYIDLNPFVANNPSPRNYEGSPATWAAFNTVSILFVVWAFHIWDDFSGVFSRIRAVSALLCAVALFLASQSGRVADQGRAGYNPSNPSPTAPLTPGGDPSIRLQEQRQTLDSWCAFAICSFIALAAIS